MPRSEVRSRRRCAIGGRQQEARGDVVEDMLYCKNREPPLDELLNDPIVRLVMARDGLSAEDVGAYVDIARRRLRERQTSEPPRETLTAPGRVKL